MAEGVFRHQTHFTTPSQKHPLIKEIDSCGTGAYHAGDRPDPRTLSVLADNGLTDFKHKARRVKVPEDFERFDYLLAMDENNYLDLREMAKRAVQKGQLGEEVIERVRLYGEFGGKSKKEEIVDPWY